CAPARTRPPHSGTRSKVTRVPTLSAVACTTRDLLTARRGEGKIGIIGKLGEQSWRGPRQAHRVVGERGRSRRKRLGRVPLCCVTILPAWQKGVAEGPRQPSTAPSGGSQDNGTEVFSGNANWPATDGGTAASPWPCPGRDWDQDASAQSSYSFSTSR